MLIQKIQKHVWGFIKAVLPSRWSTPIYKFWNIRFGDEETKRTLLVQKYDQKLAKHNILLYRPHLYWLNNPDFHTAQQSWKPKGVPTDRRFFLWQVGRLCRSLPGSTADCGIAYGTSTYFFLSGLGPRDAPHHIFDSFEGLSAPSKDDGVAWSKGDICVDERVVRENLRGFEMCRYYKGWIPSRFAELSEDNFAFVHIDVDLYEPTIDCLRFFYPRLCSGGIILGDDYGFTSCPGARKAFDEFFADKPEMLIEVPNGQVMVVKR